MNQKGKSLSASCPRKTRTVILDQKLYFFIWWKAAEAILNSWSILRKISTTESDLGKAAPHGY